MSQQGIDLAGKRYGEWLVLSKAHVSNGRRMWLCRCSCGTEKHVSGRELRNGRTRRCIDCTRANPSPQSGMRPSQLPELAGKTFGEWTAIRETESSPNRQRMWLCRCSCGTEKSVSGYDLYRGRNRGCIKCLPARRKPRRTRVVPIVINRTPDRTTSHTVETCFCASCASRRRKGAPHRLVTSG